jgi:hypothetical protein
MVGIKIFECGICKQLFLNNVKGETRFKGNRRDVREHLRKVHHINREAGKPEHKGNRLRDGKDNRSRVTQNCILFREF